MSRSADPFHLDRFVQAQQAVYARALAEIRQGRKRTHWMWYIFPQIAGLGTSSTSRYYAVSGLDEARAYLAHGLLGPRLLECCEAALCHPGRTAREIFGTPDDLKLCSCATLFAAAAPGVSVFERLLARFFAGQADAKTLRWLAARPPE